MFLFFAGSPGLSHSCEVNLQLGYNIKENLVPGAAIIIVKKVKIKSIL